MLLVAPGGFHVLTIVRRPVSLSQRVSVGPLPTVQKTCPFHLCFHLELQMDYRQWERIHCDITTHQAMSNYITIHITTLMQTLKTECDICETSQSIMIGL